MKKQLAKFFVVGMVVFGWTAMSWAVPMLNDDGSGNLIDTLANGSSYGMYINSGSIIGTVQQGNNDGETYNSGDLEAWLETELGYDTSFELSVTDSVNYTDFDGNTGTWEVIPPVEAISFYAVKAGNYFAMYLVNPAEATGSWSTYDIWQMGQDLGLSGTGGNGGLEISHFTGYNPAAPVPEPATVLLLGSGLVGLAAFGRRREKK